MVDIAKWALYGLAGQVGVRARVIKGASMFSASPRLGPLQIWLVRSFPQAVWGVDTGEASHCPARRP